jgi:hypothetical protein
LLTFRNFVFCGMTHEGISKLSPISDRKTETHEELCLAPTIAMSRREKGLRNLRLWNKSIFMV